MAEFTVVNAIALAVGVIFLANGYHMVRRGREDMVLFATSVLVGAGLIFVALFPDAFQFVAAVLGLELKARAILVMANLTLFVLVTYLLNRIGSLYEKVSRLNEEVSLLRAELEDHRDE
ncbi:MAG: DUF2304 domain-containing protein [Halobacteriota archaeon]|uniref:DUF2304 domain-containing protein n=1 Tax=Halodesulfurarchaeum sp. HSR-GB TaxID=3074077 RepID=UPI002857FD63|nr:DUF2304 domain-containing protein [Halodesulfurarchaeum sp. HSR-GB]MDR5657003.1 DUF2304 domain-containing protein [Halodesulfurarchaeum sp. HSR-GB]